MNFAEVMHFTVQKTLEVQASEQALEEKLKSWSYETWPNQPGPENFRLNFSCPTLRILVQHSHVLRSKIMEPKDTQADKLFNTLLELRKRVNDDGTSTTTVELDFWEHDNVAPWAEPVTCHDTWRGFNLTACGLRTYIRCGRDEELWRSEVEVAFRYLRGFLVPLKFKEQAILWMANASQDSAGSAIMLPWGTGYKRLIISIARVKDGVLFSILPEHNEELFEEAEKTFVSDKLLAVVKPRAWSTLLPEASFAQLNALYDRMAAELPAHFSITDLGQVKHVEE